MTSYPLLPHHSITLAHCALLDCLCFPKSIKEVNWGVLIERAYYYTSLVAWFRTIREGVLIEEGALTEVVRYIEANYIA